MTTINESRRANCIYTESKNIVKLLYVQNLEKFQKSITISVMFFIQNAGHITLCDFP